MHGVAVAWNNECTLSAMLSARALMETLAVMAEFERGVELLLKEQDLGGLDAVVQNATFASRDPEWTKENPGTKAMNVLTYIDKFNKRFEGFAAITTGCPSCHPNSLGHNFMFLKLDTSDGTVRFYEEREPQRNRQMILAALVLLPLVESISARLDELIEKVSDLHHSVAPIGGDPAPERGST